MMIVRELANELFDIGQDNDLINAMRLSCFNVNYSGTGLPTTANAFPAKRFISTRFDSIIHLVD